MIYHILTLFPDMILEGLRTSIIGRAIDNQLIDLNLVNIRDYAGNKHNKVDDYPYGGGAGMVMQPEPIYRAYEATKKETSHPRVIYLTPQGQVFNQKKAEELAKEPELVFLCGHYEGVDERILDTIVTDAISIGDYVLTGGELAVMVVIDAISRLLPGVLKNDASAKEETFYDNLLEYPQYTRPYNFMGTTVPDVLLSGHHAEIDKWRRKQALLRTLERRPDLLEKAKLTSEERNWINSKK